MKDVITSPLSLQLLGPFKLVVGQEIVHLPLQAQRVLAYLGVSEEPVPRQQLGGRLWPFTRESRAQANLRTALWRVRQEAPGSIVVDREIVHLESAVRVDYRVLLDSDCQAALSEASEEQTGIIAKLRSELLSGWDEEWLLIERERARQLRMRCLERFSQLYLEAGKTSAAIDTAYASIEIEPLRESAHLALIEAHIADGNLAEAAHQAARFEELVHQELGISSSGQFRQRLANLGVA